jgi:hypothetical protein
VIDYYAQRRAAGRCIGCPRASSKTLCLRCTQKAVRIARENRQARRLQGLCVVCGGTPRPGFVRCLACTERQRRGVAESRARRSG